MKADVCMFVGCIVCEQFSQYGFLPQMVDFSFRRFFHGFFFRGSGVGSPALNIVRWVLFMPTALACCVCMCSCVLVKVEHSVRQQGACWGEVKRAAGEEGCLGLRRQSRLECILCGVLCGVYG